MRLSRILRIPHAASMTLMPERLGDLRHRIARLAASMSNFMRPPRKFSGSSMPSTRSASVAVGSVPPRP